jgi:hypothetical protein
VAIELEPKVLMRRAAAVAALAAIVALLIPTVRHLREAPPPPPPAVRLSLAAPAGTELGIADEPLDAAVSPDQREVVFVATQRQREAGAQRPAGTSQLWRRRLDAERADPIAGTDGQRAVIFRGRPSQAVGAAVGGHCDRGRGAAAGRRHVVAGWFAAVRPR